MAESKIITHTTRTYETTDGREFEYAPEAEAWQQALEDIKTITMLDSKFNPTDDVDSAYYVHIKTYSQLEAFAAMQHYSGVCGDIPDLGYWYYDDCTETYINIKEEISTLQHIISALDTAGK